MKRKKKENIAALVNRTNIHVRFSEVDSMQVVWHGEYIKYFEDGRVSFGKQYDISYMGVLAQGYVIPIVDLTCQFKQSLRFDEEAIIETRYINTPAAKILFEYTIYRASDLTVAATGTTTQVFVNAETNELELSNPEFYLEWKKKWGIE
ncbi:thioesterase family protein [Bacteroides sp. 224]|uniref:acyl-CoA thioesterase n=1 Tax=Bacteroides sp. 224 TaxID=2302936 RepID=UPI0013D1047D|nr:thioesterase family protein [Bacteroides sp. 224]NDV64322.1 acyl-CoA thioesterase [Bacteroides sp. 224]